MKLQKFNGNKAASALGTTAGVIVGAMLSSGAAGALPAKNKTIAKAAIAIGGIALATFVGGEDTAAKAVRSIGVGMAVQQGKEMISETVAPHLPANTNAGTKFLHDAVSGGSTVATPAAALAGRRSIGRRRMASPDFDFRLANPNQETVNADNFQMA